MRSICIQGGFERLNSPPDSDRLDFPSIKPCWPSLPRNIRVKIHTTNSRGSIDHIHCYWYAEIHGIADNNHSSLHHYRNLSARCSVIRTRSSRARSPSKRRDATEDGPDATLNGFSVADRPAGSFCPEPILPGRVWASASSEALPDLVSCCLLPTESLPTNEPLCTALTSRSEAGRGGSAVDRRGVVGSSGQESREAGGEWPDYIKPYRRARMFASSVDSESGGVR